MCHGQIFGIKYGLRGFYERATKPVHLTPEVVDGIQLRGGTILVRLGCTRCFSSTCIATAHALSQTCCDLLGLHGRRQMRGLKRGLWCSGPCLSLLALAPPACLACRALHGEAPTSRRS